MSLAVQLADTGNVLGTLGCALVITEMVFWWRGDPRPAMECAGWALFVIADILYAVGDLMRQRWGAVAWDLILATYFAWLLWRRWRKHRKTVAALLGAKSRALRDALVRRQREVARSRPVLRPVPQGGAGR